MIDIHCHILPGVDDGSANVEMSKQLLEMLHAQGVDALVATPHFYATEDTPEQFLQRRAEGFDALEKAGVDIGHILPGAEVAYYNGMYNSQELEQLQLGNSGLLLIEMPFCDWDHQMMDTLCSIPDHLGLRPVLAHVERYPGRRQLRKYADMLLDNGIFFQCNASAFLKGFKSRRYFRMLQEGNIHFLGSDCHNLTTRAPQLDLAAEVIAKKIGPGMLPELSAYARELLFPET